MRPKTLDELFNQIEIDANNRVVYNKKMYLNFAKEIFSEYITQQRLSAAAEAATLPNGNVR